MPGSDGDAFEKLSIVILAAVKGLGGRRPPKCCSHMYVDARLRARRCLGIGP